MCQGCKGFSSFRPFLAEKAVAIAEPETARSEGGALIKKKKLKVTNYKRYTYLFFVSRALCFALLLAGCRSKIKTQAVQPEEKSAFYTLTLSRDSTSKETKAAITNVIVANVKIRYQPDEAKAKEPNFLSIEITYKNNAVVRVFTEHPLYKRFDLYSESGQIESKLISLQKGEVVFRVPYFSDYKKIRITETVERKTAPPITLTHEK